MTSVSEVTIKYAARGAKAAQKADRSVRESIQQTAQTAREQSGTISRWMQRHREAMIGIGVATTAAMAAIIRASPTLQAELSTVRLGFSLLAMQIGQDLAPALRGLGDISLGLADAYSDLPGPIRKFTSALIGISLVGGTVAGLLAGLQTLIQGTFIATMGSKAVGAISSFIAGSTAAMVAIGAIIGLFGVWILEVTGVLKWVGNLASGLRSLIGGPLTDLLLTIGTLTGILPVVATIGAAIVGFIRGGFSGAIDAAMKALGVFGNAIIRTFGRLRDIAASGMDMFIDAIRTGLRWLAENGPGIVGDGAVAIGDAILRVIESLNPVKWGRDIANNIARGLRRGAGDVADAAGDIKGKIESKISFDQVQNDRMARRWGADLVKEFSKGMERERTTMSRSGSMARRSVGGTMQSTAPGTGGGGGGGNPPVVVRFERGSIMNRGPGERPEVDDRNVSQEQGSAFSSRSNV